MRGPVVQDFNVLEGGPGKVQKEWDHHAPSVPHYLWGTTHPTHLHLRDITSGQLLAVSQVAWH